MVVRLHSGAARKLSVTSNAGAGTQTSEFVNGEMIQTNGTYSASQQHQMQKTTYMAEIHNVECASSETTSSAAATCFASGLEITFESLPQTIDIRLIPENDADPTSSSAVSSATHAVANITTGGVDVVARTRTGGGAVNGIHQGAILICFLVL